MERKEIFAYIKDNYNVSPEYLWSDTPEFAVFRHENSKKWFGIIMNVNGEEYFNVKTDPNYSDLLRNSYNYIIPAYHMNKEHWNTIIVSRKIDKNLFFELLEQSYELTKK